MNYAYLFIDNLNNHSYEKGFDELRASLKVLKNNIGPEDNIIVFNNEFYGKNIEFFKQENLIHRYIIPSRNYKGSDAFSPLNILVEKIISLMNFNDDEDIVLMDIDTTTTQPIPQDYWNSNTVVFNCAEYSMMSARNLNNVLPHIPWTQFDIKLDYNHFVMFNTGVIYIPKQFRKELCEKALSIVDYLNNNFDADDRFGNKLDEQIALSIVIQDFYGNNIRDFTDYIYHYWRENQQNINWWEQFI